MRRFFCLSWSDCGCSFLCFPSFKKTRFCQVLYQLKHIYFSWIWLYVKCLLLLSDFLNYFRAKYAKRPDDRKGRCISSTWIVNSQHLSLCCPDVLLFLRTFLLKQAFGFECVFICLLFMVCNLCTLWSNLWLPSVKAPTYVKCTYSLLERLTIKRMDAKHLAKKILELINTFFCICRFYTAQLCVISYFFFFPDLAAQ